MPNQRKNPAVRKRRTQIKIFLTDEDFSSICQRRLHP